MKDAKEEEFEYCVEALKEYIYEGVFGADPLDSSLGNDWSEILSEALARAVSQYGSSIAKHTEEY